MLQQLSIQNYAIIDELEINLSPKLNMITGETGAGKSIIMGALSLILGERADTSVLVDKSKKCMVEGLFSVKNKKEIREFYEENELDESDELIIRREIGVNGKTRAFVNDTPVTLDLLQRLSSLLVDLHQQFDTLQLGESDFQRETLDALAGHVDLAGMYHDIFRQWQNAGKEWEELKAKKQQFDKEADYNRFQYNELSEAGFTDNELEEIDAELRIMNNAEGIKTVLNKLHYDLEESDNPLVQQLKILSNQLAVYSAYHSDMEALIQRIHSAQVELQDISGEAERISSHVNYDAEKVQLLSDRLSVGYKLLKKHGVKTTGELITIQKELEEKLQSVLNMDEEIRQKGKEVERYFDEATKLAERISEGRKKQVKPLEDKVNKLLAQVGMPSARLKVEILKGELNPFGFDKIEFLFNANLPAKGSDKNISFLPVRKVASGGELSRLMLCIKSLVAKSIDLPTMIFDEIDTGISGEAARQAGIIMKDLASKRQVICITHQPQIAGKADAHYLVYKEIVKDKVKTNIRLLTTEERITTIAKMLSGEKPTAAAIENAREMVGN